MYGRQDGGCGATIGVMPRCDFACRGCYLGAEANHVPAADLAELRRQIDRLREQLGDGGDLQLTDGEVTLRPVNELIELIRYARGRTDPSIAAVVDVADLWRAIADGVIEDGESGVQQRRAEFLLSHVHFGHPACNRVLPGLAARSGRRTRYVPLWRPHVSASAEAWRLSSPDSGESPFAATALSSGWPGSSRSSYEIPFSLFADSRVMRFRSPGAWPRLTAWHDLHGNSCAHEHGWTACCSSAITS